MLARERDRERERERERGTECVCVCVEEKEIFYKRELVNRSFVMFSIIFTGDLVKYLKSYSKKLINGNMN